MNWDNLFRFLYKCFLISYMILWSIQLGKNQSGYLNNLKEVLHDVQTRYLSIIPSFSELTEQIIVYYSHFLFVTSVTLVFSWSISRYLSIIVLLINFLLLSTRKQLMFMGIDIILLAIVIQVQLKDKKKKQNEDKS